MFFRFRSLTLQSRVAQGDVLDSGESSYGDWAAVYSTTAAIQRDRIRVLPQIPILRHSGAYLLRSSASMKFARVHVTV